MDARFAAAEVAFKEQRAEEGVSLLIEALEAEGGGPLQAYRQLAAALIHLGRYEEARRWAQEGADRYAGDFDVWNMLGVSLRRLGRSHEALKALDRALKVRPNSAGALMNKGAVFNDLKEGAKALPLYTKLARHDPTNAEYQRGLGTAYRHLGDVDKAHARFAAAVRLQPKRAELWMERVALASEHHRHDEAVSIVEQALQAAPDSLLLQEAMVKVFRRAGRHPDAVAYLRRVLERDDQAAWAHYQLGRTLMDSDRQTANAHFVRAVELAPTVMAHRMILADSLERSRYGEETQHIQAAYETLLEAQKLGPIPSEYLHIARQVFTRLGDHARAAALGEFSELGGRFARDGRHSALLQMLGSVRSAQDRLDLIDFHKTWGDIVQKEAARAPVRRPPRRPSGKVRIGFNSSDLRRHPVAYFAMPLFDFADRERFEIYCYSFFQGAEDPAQTYIASKVDAFRWRKSISDHDAAQMMADDQLDILFELGSTTHMNRLEVMAYKPAPLQASWLGYPHSSGLTTIDYLLVDPYLTPPDERLLIEKPLQMPKSWIALSRYFGDDPPVEPTPPQERNGFVTFGTANNPYKYSPEVLRVWAEIVAAVPGSRFMFVRPESGTPAFRDHMLAHFEAAGVPAERVRFESVRGAHMPFYNQIDVTLDTFPQTGGTTTCEALWMGAPVVSLVGPALFERLSHSILNNSGLGDLSVEDVESYKAKALELAADIPRLRDLRANLRQRMNASPLGQREQFARDFYDLVETTVRNRR